VKKVLYGILAVFLAATGVTALYADDGYDFSRFLRESGDFVQQPGRWQGSDLLKLGILCGGTAALYQYDQDVRDNVKKNPNVKNDIAVRIGEQWGGYYVIPLSAIGFGTYGWLADDALSRKMGFETAQGVIYAEAISLVMKFSIGRARPFTNLGPHDYKSFSVFKGSFNSFPAGHVDAAFVLSTVIYRNTDSGVIKALAYVPAGLTVVSRIYRDIHWTSDCLFGAGIGYFVGNWVVDQHGKNESGIHVTSLYPPSVGMDF